MADIQKKIDAARAEVFEFAQINGDEEDGKSLVEIADLMVEN